MKFMVKLLVLVFVLVPSLVWAAPFLVCDPQAGVTHYALTGPSWVPATVSAQPDGSIRMDVSSSTVGNNSLTLKACKSDPLWGELCSDPATPFAFPRPSGAVSPANIWLSP